MIKRNKIKILIATLITAITTCIFLITSYAQEGYTINNGNIESLNLFNINDVASGTSANIDTSTGVASGYDTKNIFNFQVQYITSNYNYFTIYSTDIYTPQIVSYTFTKTNDMYWLQFGHNGSSADVKVRYDIHTLENTTYTISFNILSITNPQSFNNIMLNTGNTALDYFPYGDYTNNNSVYGANGFYNNVKSITYMDQGTTQINLDTTTAYKYLSIATLNIEDLLTANGITNTQQRQTRRQLLEIILDKPINLSNFIYYLQFNGDPKGTPPEDYYISFFNDNPNITGSNDSSIFYFENTEYINNVGYKLELKGSMFINEIDIYWENLESDTCWPYRMTSSEYNIGLEAGKNQGYATGYKNGINQGIQQGIEQGIEQANSQINKNSASYVAGYSAGEQSQNNLGGMVITIMESPINMFKQMFNFDILGFNISNFLFSLVSLLLIAYIIKKLIK